jgi:hypothetical protein
MFPVGKALPASAAIAFSPWRVSSSLVRTPNLALDAILWPVDTGGDAGIAAWKVYARLKCKK